VFFCSQSKITKKSHKSVVKESEPLNLIHSDICEFDGMLTKNGKRYFITFIYDCSDYTYVYLMKNKSEALDMFKLYVTGIENQFNKKIKKLRSGKAQSMIPVCLMSFIICMESYMRRLLHIHLK